MKIKDEFVFIRISEAERDNLFSKSITRTDGTVVKLFTGIQAAKGSEESYSQSVTLGEVVAVGDRVAGIRTGDTVILDYVVDLSPENEVETSPEGKTVCIRAVTTYKGYDNVVDANRRTPHPTVVHRTGEIDEFSMVIAAVRDGEVLPVKPYLFCAYVPQQSDWEARDGGSILTVDALGDDNVSERRVLYAYEGAEFGVGDIVLANNDGVFDRTLRGQRFDIIPEHEIFATLKP
jgi:co-chaperonin GroES (HSP10)